jgi:hypothetical protein
MMRRVARSYRLSRVQVEDVVQTAWMRAFEHIGDLRAAEVVPFPRTGVGRVTPGCLRQEPGEAMFFLRWAFSATALDG